MSRASRRAFRRSRCAAVRAARSIASASHRSSSSASPPPWPRDRSQQVRQGLRAAAGRRDAQAAVARAAAAPVREPRRTTAGGHAARAFDAVGPLRRVEPAAPHRADAGEPATPFGRRIELRRPHRRAILLGAERSRARRSRTSPSIGPWELDAPARAAAEPNRGPPRPPVDDAPARRAGTPPRLVLHIHGRYGSGPALARHRNLPAPPPAAASRRCRPPHRVAPAALDEALLLLARESMLEPTALCLENADAAHGRRAASAPPRCVRSRKRLARFRR